MLKSPWTTAILWALLLLPRVGVLNRANALMSNGNPAWPQVWMQSDKDMVGCDGCDFWIHTACDEAAAIALRASAAGEEVPYYCPSCSAQQEGAAQLAALAAAEDQLRRYQPRRARSAYYLFAADIHK
jgi:PHD-finger